MSQPRAPTAVVRRAAAAGPTAWRRGAGARAGDGVKERTGQRGRLAGGERRSPHDRPPPIPRRAPRGRGAPDGRSRRSRYTATLDRWRPPLLWSCGVRWDALPGRIGV